MHIRPFAPGDYDAVVAIHNRIDEDNPQTADGLAEQDRLRALRYQSWREVAEVDGAVVGHAWYGEHPDLPSTRRWTVDLQVDPAFRRQGIGAALYRNILSAADARAIESLRCEAREDWPGSARFIEHRGFRETLRFWESWLEVARFDFTPYEGYEDRLKEQGVALRSLRSLEDDPDRDQKLYDLLTEIAMDIPSDAPFEPQGIEEFREQRLKRPDQIPEAYLIAVLGDDYVGISNVRRRADRNLATGVTGVRRPYRGQGIALALKLKNIAYARKNGHPYIITGNESRNLPILAINERLGFERRPAWVTYVRPLAGTDAGRV